MMKRMLLIIILATISLNAQWEVQNPRFYNLNFRHVQFTDTQNGYLLSHNGLILKSTNSGENWQTVFSDTSSPVRKMFFSDADYGWLMNDTGKVIFKTTNGGSNWQTYNQPVRDVFFTGKDTGFAFSAANDSSVVLKTTDGGGNWFEVLGLDNYNEIYFFSDMLGFIMGRENGKLWRTSDAGASWQLSEIPAAGCPTPWRIVEMQFISESVGFYIRKKRENVSIDYCDALSYLSKTTDGGITWQVINSYFGGSFQFFDENNGWQINENSMNRTTDGGINWQSAGLLGATFLRDIQSVNNNVGFIAGDYGLLYKTTNGGQLWRHLNGPRSGVTGAYFFDEINGWAAGDGGISRTTDGGKNWNVVFDSLGIILRGISFRDENVGFAVGWTYHPTKAYILRTDNGGDSWYIFKEFPSTNFQQIDFIDSTIGYFQFNPGFYKTTDGGENWFDILPGTFSRDFFFLDTQRGWNASYKYENSNFINTFLKTTNGGTTWDTVAINIKNYVTAIYFFNDSLGFVTGTHQVMKTTDGGETWTNPLTITDDVFFHEIHFVGNYGWAAGLGGILFATIDGGNSWRPDCVPPNRLVKIKNVNNHVWAFGEQGVILHQELPLTLAIEITSFTATPNSGSVKLDWVTSAESNTKGFEVQRTISEASQWQDIAFIAAKGTTSEQQFYSYEDKEITGGNVKYRLKNISIDGSFTLSDEVAPSTTTSVSDETLPDEFSLSQNYPNPFNPATTIKYSIPVDAFAAIKIYDVLGNEVAVLVNEYKTPGRYEVSFDAANLSSGVYYYSIKAGNFSEVRKMMLLK